jgi:hypothetical protein
MNERTYTMVWNPLTDLVEALNGAGKVVAKIASPSTNKSMKLLFGGAKKITVKADIIDGVFTVQKRIK